MTRFTNTPFDELIRLAKDSNNELGIELAQRFEQEIEWRMEEKCDCEREAEDGYDRGFSEGRDDTISWLNDKLCEACSPFLGGP